MPTFCLINPDLQTIELKSFVDYKDALEAAGLKNGSIDFETVGAYHANTLQIIVFDLGLMNPIQNTYFRLGRQLFNGNAVLFAANMEGDTVDFPEIVASHWHVCPEFEWLASIEACEEAIKSGRLDRPQSSINGQVFWSWNSKETKH